MSTPHQHQDSTGATDTPQFAELVAASNYSFLYGASHPKTMLQRAHALGLEAIGIADRNTVAGVVRAHMALRELHDIAAAEGQVPPNLRLIVGARLVFSDATPDIIAYPATRHGWGRLTRLLTVGNMRAVKGDCILRFNDLLDHCADLMLIVLPESSAREQRVHAKPLIPEPTPPMLTLVPPEGEAPMLHHTVDQLSRAAPGRVCGWAEAAMMRGVCYACRRWQITPASLFLPPATRFMLNRRTACCRTC